MASTYYKLSPPVAAFINDHPALNPMVRVGLLPAVAASSIAVNTTLVEKTVTGSSMAVVFALAVV